VSWKNTLRKYDELEDANKYREVVKEMWKKSNMPLNEGEVYDYIIEDLTDKFMYEFRHGFKFEDIPESFLNTVKEEIQYSIDEMKRKGPPDSSY